MDRSTQRRADSVQSQDSEALKYYQESILAAAGQDAFQNLDDPNTLQNAMQAVSSSFSRNFLLDFSDSDAWVGFDLSAETILNLLDSKPRPDELSTRWINVWYPFQHKVLLELLGKHYDFSPRLLAMMCSDPRTPTTRPSALASHLSAGEQSSFTPRSCRSQSDVEKGAKLPEIASVSSNNPARTGNIYDIADEVWNYTSVDQGRNCKCYSSPEYMK